MQGKPDRKNKNGESEQKKFSGIKQRDDGCCEMSWRHSDGPKVCCYGTDDVIYVRGQAELHSV